MNRKEINKILIVDDVKMIRLVLQKELTNKGFKVISADNGLDAIEICNSDNKPDLVLLDLKLPDMSGINVLRQIKTDNPDIPIIVVSAVNDTDTINKAISYGASDFMVKPINFDRLLAIIQKIKEGNLGVESDLKKAAIITNIGHLRLALKKILTEEKFTVIDINNRDEFDEKIKFRKFDLILLDYDFDMGNGLHYIDKLLEKKVDLNKLILIIPNTLDSDEILFIRKKGIKNILLKPISADNLIEKVRGIVGNKK